MKILRRSLTGLALVLAATLAPAATAAADAATEPPAPAITEDFGWGAPPGDIPAITDDFGWG
ncbi:hypothetical protein [Streptomyces sp. NPDC057557]|uniref:hypothetical protein n=1 Tax=Streptomyces sp. NPDC057557 TaxID=3346167 RepID=UPI00368FC957